MKVSHINHVVLYAKNWYRHTGDLIGDLAQMLRMDHPGKRVYATKQEILDQMMFDYGEWIGSIENEHDRQYKANEFYKEDFGVRWEDDKQLAAIWGILISYSIYIRDFGGILEPPKYDFENNLFPQYDLYPIDPFGAISRDAPAEEYIKAAEKYLSAPLIDVLKTSFMSAKYDFDYDLVIKCLGKSVDKKYTDNNVKTAKWIDSLMWKLWNVVWKKVKYGKYVKYYNTERIGPLMTHINLDRCDYDMSFVIDFGHASAAQDLTEEENELDLKEQMIKLYDIAASRLNREKLKKVFLFDNYSGIGLHIGDNTNVTSDEFIDDHISHLKECYFNDIEELISSSYMQSGIFAGSIDIEQKKVTIWYSVTTAFGTHEHSLRNKATGIDDPHF